MSNSIRVPITPNDFPLGRKLATGSNGSINCLEFVATDSAVLAASQYSMLFTPSNAAGFPGAIIKRITFNTTVAASFRIYKGGALAAGAALNPQTKNTALNNTSATAVSSQSAGVVGGTLMFQVLLPTAAQYVYDFTQLPWYLPNAGAPALGQSLAFNFTAFTGTVSINVEFDEYGC